jgi:hypothetical protein
MPRGRPMLPLLLARQERETLDRLELAQEDAQSIEHIYMYIKELVRRCSKTTER